MRLGVVLLTISIGGVVLAGASCSLNPQPLPPLAPDGSTLGTTDGMVHSDAGFSDVGAGPGDGGVPELDGSPDGNSGGGGPDGGDGGEEGSIDGSFDGSIDAPTDGATDGDAPAGDAPVD